MSTRQRHAAGPAAGRAARSGTCRRPRASTGGSPAVADGVGPNKDRVIPRTATGALDTPTSLVADAHVVGLLVHPYTFRNENVFLPTELRVGTAPDDYGKAFAEYEAFFRAGIDGLFSDNPDTAVAARDAYNAQQPAA